jgi:hypothetical protein
MDQSTLGINKMHRTVVLVCAMLTGSVLAGSMLAASMSGHAQSSKLTKGPIGMETGEKAPSFRLKDQFGREQSNDTLRGTNGTVLLFFRSADW